MPAARADEETILIVLGGNAFARPGQPLTFTAAQIPFIADRAFPRELAGPGYEGDIPIFPEEQLPERGGPPIEDLVTGFLDGFK